MLNCKAITERISGIGNKLFDKKNEHEIDWEQYKIVDNCVHPCMVEYFSSLSLLLSRCN